MSLTNTSTGKAIVDVLEGLAPAALDLVLKLVQGAKDSDDAERYLRRKLEADGAHLASQEVAAAALEGLR